MKYAVCKLSVVPVRKNPSDSSEQVTQLIFGDAFEIIESQEKWLKILQAFDGYEGWIDPKQAHKISEKDFQKIIKSKETFCGNFVGAMDYEGNTMYIPFGGILHLEAQNQVFWTKERMRFADKIQKTKEANPKNLILIAKTFLNVPYLWGGKTVYGIDCSGFMQAIFRMVGIKLKRDAYQQAEQGKLIENFNERKTTDLAFFHNDKGKVIHVGMLIDQNRIIHASGQVRIDQFDENGIFNETKKEHTHFLHSINRMV